MNVMAVAAPQPMQPPRIPPMVGERQGAYVERADRALAKSIPDRYARMTAIAQEWAVSANEKELQQRAKAALASAVDTTPDKLDQYFVTRTNRPIFPEHETRSADGTVQRYDRAALQGIVDRCNRRILDTGDLAAMSAGHTPTPEQHEKGMPMPDMVGFTGPFRLGLIGQDAPRWCIMADEHVFRDEINRVKKMPRRSPEVWMVPKMTDRVLDPIAVLGAETPRLDTGIGRFSSRHGKLNPTRYTTARYSMAAAMPSGTNTFNVTEKYSAGDSMDDDTIQSMVQAVIQGLSATPQWQWITDQMQGEQNPMPEDQDQGPTPSPDAAAAVPGADGSQPGAMPGGDATGATPDAGAAMQDAGSAAATPDAGGAPMPTPSTSPTDAGGGSGAGPDASPDAGGGDSGATPDELAAMGDDEKAEYSRLSPTHQYGYMKARRRHVKPGATGTMQYANPVERDRYAKIESRLKATEAELYAVRRERTVAQRYSRLADLANEFDLDPAAEQAETAAMTDEQFDRHCAVTIAKYSRRDPMDGMPTLPLKPLYQVVEKSQEEARVEKYSRLAIELATKDPSLTADQAFDKAKELIGRT